MATPLEMSALNVELWINDLIRSGDSNDPDQTAVSGKCSSPQIMKMATEPDRAAFS